MYQGKFSSNNSKQKQLNQQLLAERSSQPAPAALPRGQANTRPVQKKAENSQPSRGTAKRNAVQNDFQAAVQAEGYTEQATAAPRRRGPTLGAVIFYTLYLLFIAGFVGATFFGLNWLNGWLINYEAAQPTVKCQQVFNTLFKEPDWGTIYDLAGLESTKYESKEAYVSYMQEKVSDVSQLNFVETSAGISNDKKYYVRYGEEKIGSFTLRDAKAEENAASELPDIPDWQLGTVELMVSRNETYRISKVDNHIAYVNGVALDDEFTIQRASTSADSFLPVGIKSASTCVQEISGLLMKPEVVVKTAAGQETTVVYDEVTRTFTEQTEANTIPDDLKQLASNTAEAYGEYTFGGVGLNSVAKYFATDSDSYKTIAKLEQWNRSKWATYATVDRQVSEYSRYADNVFSARVKIKFTLNLKVGGTMDWDVDSTFFFNKRDAGWVCYAMTNEDVQTPVGEVRLTFMDGSTKLDSRFYRTDAKDIELPVVSVPAGKTFGGWVKESVNASGARELTVMFTPDESGKVTLNPGTNLEPMTLYTYFE